MLASKLPELVDDDEDLARFLVSNNQFSVDKQVVKPGAFLPSPRDGETSVYRHGSEPRAALWSIGEEHVAGKRTIYGAGIIKAAAVRSAELAVLADEPPPRHAAIRNWPWLDDPELRKAQQKEKAILLASKAILVLREQQT